MFGDKSLAFPELGAETPDVPVAEEEEADEEDDAELQAALQVCRGGAWQSPLGTRARHVALTLNSLRGLRPWTGKGWAILRHERTSAIPVACCGVQASLEQTARPVGIARDRPAASAADVAMPGLRNETGEYNCFLNVIIQCLWHCSDFRAAIMALPPDMLEGAGSCLLHDVPCEPEI